MKDFGAEFEIRDLTHGERQIKVLVFSAGFSQPRNAKPCDKVGWGLSAQRGVSVSVT
jgi:hypothetical protein